MSKFSEKLRTFMYGRNGTDALYWFYNGLYLTFFVAYCILIRFNNAVCLYSGYACLALFILFFVLTMFRFYSKNVVARRRENDRFVNFFKGFKIRANRRRRAFKERKDFIYKRCPNCKQYLRLKRIKGEHTVKCPKCNNTFGIKVK